MTSDCKSGTPEEFMDDTWGSLGLWRCSGCGEAYENDCNPAWRWTGKSFEHKCSGNDPQYGYEPAEWFGPREVDLMTAKSDLSNAAKEFREQIIAATGEPYERLIVHGRDIVDHAVRLFEAREKEWLDKLNAERDLSTDLWNQLRQVER